MFEKIRGFLMNIFSILSGQSVKELTGQHANLSADMYGAIRLCNAVMAHSAPWNKKAPSCGIPDQIAGMLSETVMQEIGLEVANPALQRPLAHLNANLSKIVQYVALTGSALVRPVYANGKLQYDVLQLGSYLPLLYDFDGTLLSCLVFKCIEDPARADSYFLLVEKQEYSGGAHAVTNTLYRGTGGVLRKARLTDCPQTAGLTEAYTWHNVARPMVIEFRSHVINKIDGSNIPVALVWGAVDLIKAADRQFARMDWEQEAGKKKIFADRDLFARRQAKDGGEAKAKLSPELNDLIVQIDGDGSADGSKIKEFSPELRTSAQAEYFQQVLRRIESALNLGKGSVSNLEGVQQTATQYSGGRKSFYSIVDTLEDEIERKMQDCADVFAHIAAAYGLGSADSTIRIIWNDGLRKDPLSERQQAMQEVAAGLMGVAEYRMKFYGEDEATARKKAEELKPAQGAFVL